MKVDGVEYNVAAIKKMGKSNWSKTLKGLSKDDIDALWKSLGLPTAKPKKDQDNE